MRMLVILMILFIVVDIVFDYCYIIYVIIIDILLMLLLSIYYLRFYSRLLIYSYWYGKMLSIAFIGSQEEMLLFSLINSVDLCLHSEPLDFTVVYGGM